MDVDVARNLLPMESWSGLRLRLRPNKSSLKIEPVSELTHKLSGKSDEARLQSSLQGLKLDSLDLNRKFIKPHLCLSFAVISYN